MMNGQGNGAGQAPVTGAGGAAQDLKTRFAGRPKLLVNKAELEPMARTIVAMLAAGQFSELPDLLHRAYPADLADVMDYLNEQQDKAVFDLLDVPEAAQVLDEVDCETREKLVKSTPPERLAAILAELPADEGADIAGALDGAAAEAVLARLDPRKAEGIHRLLPYPPETAGGIMSTGYVAVAANATVAQAIDAYRTCADGEPTPEVFVVDEQGALVGVAELRTLLNAEPDSSVSEHMTPAPVTVTPDFDQERAARVFARYNLTSLPVVEPLPSHRLIGIITSDDMIDVIEEESTEDALRMAGSDAAEMERRSPARTALLRLPWIMATMFIELGAGVVIHAFDATLARVLLLASFMPIISAISGNTGLQSATIIVRGLSTGQIGVGDWRRAVTRQLTMTLILGTVAGLTLGVIGTIWYGKWTFGLVVCVGMFAAVNIAGFVGTVVPLISRSLGFDPAITSGPFETAFQDVVGISIFLGLATVLLHYLL